MATATAVNVGGPRRARLWFGVLAAPLAWSVQLVVGWALEEMIACTPGAGFSGVIWGVDVRTLILAMNAALGGIVLAALASSVRARGRLRAANHSTGEVDRWMATAGIINSVVFGILVFTGFLPPLTLEVCRTTP